MTRGSLRGAAAFIAGTALGATTAAGNALLLYTGQGFLRAAGLLVGSTIMAVAAGIWAGSPDNDTDAGVGSRGRWVALILVLLAGGAFSALWATRPVMRQMAVGGAFAVLLVLAMPAYTAGALLVALHARERASLAPPATGSVAGLSVAGAATGVLLSTTVLIPNLEPYGVYYGGAGLLILAALLEWQLPGRGPTRGAPDMRDHVAIITGVSDAGQVGFSIARRFHDAGARVLITGRSPQVEELAARLDGAAAVHAMTADLMNDDDVRRLIELATERYGRVDALVNVAGGLSVMKPIAETTPDEWRHELARNTETVLRLSRAALPLLRESGGAIVNFAAPAGLRAVAGLGAYSAAKAGVIALTRALALEEKKNGVRVNAIAPGIVDTDQNRESMGDDTVFVPRDDVASVALFLAGPGARGISGETIHVMGATLR